ncbi:MAG: class I SAM-dependent methyltransferase [Candidatus Sumerlaeota bacterium]|nr:class I SAM-dependent methyltransferase [Candidatus Sumerlaeota bacterium]
MMNEKEQALQREKEFHDIWASTIAVEKISVIPFFEGSTAPENRFILRHLGDVKGKRLLDLGCGAGENSVYFALKGASCLATDFSPGMVKTALELAETYGVAIQARVMDAMKMDLPDESFDIVYASNLLHHVDPRRTLDEMHRILKKGGKACFWDPLRHNPIINIYRRMATEVRSPDEHPLHINIVKDVQARFSSVEYDTFWLATLWIFLQFYLIERVHPNKERYWKKIITEEPRLRKTYRCLECIDNFIKRIPGLRRMAWNIAVVATK